MEVHGTGVVINAVNTTRALALTTDDSLIRGLTIHDASGAAAVADGIQVTGNRNHLESNQIGTDVVGNTLNHANLTTGVVITGNANIVKGGVIADSSGNGLTITGDRNMVLAGRIGLPYDGGIGSPNGVSVTGDENQIGTLSTGDRNVISGNRSDGVVIAGNHNRVEGNYVGLDETGATGPGNINNGVSVVGNENLVSGNVASLNDTGVRVDGTNNTVMANAVGTDAARTAAQGNGRDGVRIVGGIGNVVGGDLEVEGNLIAANLESGVQLDGGGLGHRVEGNDIGAAGLPNAEGVVVSSSLTVVTGNLVSKNSDAGIVLDYWGLGQPLAGNAVEDNEVTGNAKGVVVEDAHVNTITDNVISGNAGEGVLIAAVDLNNADGNRLTGNTITGNGSSGVRIDAADENSVGAVGGDVNVISGNGGDGVTVTTGQDNAVVNNSIFDNGDLGIDLVDDGPTVNDGLGDVDAGPNQQQNHPTISNHQLVKVQVGGLFIPKSRISWTLRSTPATDYRLEFYLNDTCAGRGEAKELLGTQQVITDGTGLVQGSIDFAPVDENVTVTATVTDPNGFVDGPTSELSGCG